MQEKRGFDTFSSDNLSLDQKRERESASSILIDYMNYRTANFIEYAYRIKLFLLVMERTILLKNNRVFLSMRSHSNSLHVIGDQHLIMKKMALIDPRYKAPEMNMNLIQQIIKLWHFAIKLALNTHSSSPFRISISVGCKVVWMLNSVNCHLGETLNAEITF